MRWCGLLLVVFACLSPSIATGQDVVLSKADLIRYLSQPKLAQPGHYKYGLRDSAGNRMDCCSVIDLVGRQAKYAAVYHSSYAAGKGFRYKVNLATSDDLIHWTYRKSLVDNADMPRINRVAGQNAFVLVHEQWMKETSSGASQSPSRIGFKLYDDDSNLLAGNVRASWVAPSFSKFGLDGTPNFYDIHWNAKDEGPVVETTVGFHFWDGTRDANAFSRIANLFSRSKPTSWEAVSMDRFNNELIKRGATGNIGQRESVATSDGGYLVVEANTGKPARSWDKWRIWLCELNDGAISPDRSRSFTKIVPLTHNGSKSFGNPSVSFVKQPTGVGHRIVISYFLFHEGATGQEAGSLIYFFDLPRSQR